MVRAPAHDDTRAVRDAEGPAVEGVAILEFATVDAARDCYRSPAYQNANRHQHLGADYTAVIIEVSKPPSAPSISE
jgi:uncharacterized protein (DUF1330 family)